MSGGVDSSVAALLLKQRGYRVIGATLRLAPSTRRGADPGPGGEESILLARRICERLGIEHITVDCVDAFRERVVGRFIEEYRAGRTPNPCITCNEKIKFPFLAAAADRMGCRSIATGHYAGLVRRGKVLLSSSPDSGKDQSYFLYRVPVSILERAIFPLQGMSKEHVLSKAKKHGLRERRTIESQDVCFLGGTDLQTFLSRHLPARDGEVIDSEARVLGRHGGVHSYTIGQRRGLGISADRPLYVTSVDAESNLVTLGADEELYSSTVVCTSLRMRFRKLEGALRAKIRYRHAAAPVERLERIGRSLSVRFREPQRAVTPGQSLVLYRGGLIVGGGVISSAER